MPRTISSATGRISLMVVIGVCFVVALVVLFSVFGGGAISSENQSSAFFKILGFYVPLLTLIATFFFKENLGGTSSDTPFETFIVAMFIILIWAVTPIMLFLGVTYVEDILGYIDKLTPVGQSIALMALGYYFTRKPSP